MRAVCGVIFSIFMLQITAWAQVSKTDPQLTALLLSPERRATAAREGLLKYREDSQYVQAIMTVSGSTVQSAAAGARILWRRGDLVIAELPVERVSAIAALPEVVYVAADRRARLCNDIGVKDIGALQARDEAGLSGRGVLIGVIDSGIDFAHQDFRTADGRTRIKSILDMSAAGNYYGGKVYSEEDINAALNGGGFVGQRDIRGHGTHVAGIAAGDGSSDGVYGEYAGTAPAADLIVVKAVRGSATFELLESDQLIALGFVDSVAAALERPYVANLSFGTDFGAHDGTAAVERYIDQLSGDGKVIVVSAGNQGDNEIHAVETLSGGSKEITFRIEEYNPQAGIGNDQILLDGWYNGSGQLAVTLVSPQNNTYGPVSDGSYREWNSADGYILILNGFYPNGPYYQSGVNPFNGDKEILLVISDESGSGNPTAGTWTIRLSGRANPVHFWLADASMEAAFVKGLSADVTLTIPGTAAGAITVGAYTTRDTWKDLDGNNLTIDTQGTILIGDIAAFSGAGPTRDRRVKPEITAPGQIIASAYSTDAPAASASSIFRSPSPAYPNAFIMPDGLHALSLGTSMAAPYVTGVCALLLEKYPRANAARIKELLTYTARRPSFSGNTNKWGYGKLDARQAALIDITTLPDSSDTTSSTGYEVSSVWPNPCSPGLYEAKITYILPEDAPSTITLNIYNRLGRRIRSISRSSSPYMENIISWDCRDRSGRPAASGIYFLEFRSGAYKHIQKLTVIRHSQ